jgi:hypothetical protein
VGVGCSGLTAAAGAAITGNELPPCCHRGHRSRRPRGHRSRHRRPPPHSGHADARLRADARGRDGGVRAGVLMKRAAMSAIGANPEIICSF